MSTSASASLFRYALCVLSLLSVVPAAAQMRDVENAAPRVAPVVVDTPVMAAAPVALPSELLHELANLLQLRPDQLAVVRRALATSLAAPGAQPAGVPTADAELHQLLSETQLARLQQWEAALPTAERANLVATLR